MLPTDILKHLNKIVTLDLVNGKEVTTRINLVNDGTITCSKLLMFVPIPDETNPNNQKIIALPYGYPMNETGDEINLRIEHIITAFTPSQDQQNSYAKHTGSIVAAPASALDQLSGIDLSKFQR
jgi:hypothetical protein